MDYYNNYQLDGIYCFELTESDKLLLDACIYIVDNKTTIRKTAIEFCMSKSNLHRKTHNNLRKLSYELYCCVVYQLHNNKAEYFY